MPDETITLKVWLDRLAAAEDPPTREACVRALELLGHTGALPALAEIFATDTDANLRSLAQEAGKTIYYAAIRRAWESMGPSDEERRRAAEILAQAQSRKAAGRRGS